MQKCFTQLNKNKCKCTIDRELTDAGPQAPSRRCMCTRQVAALFCLNWRYGRRLEIVMSSEIWPSFLCVFTSKNNPAKFHVGMTYSTRKLCYRKDDRAMRPRYRCPENFGESLSTPTPLVSKIFFTAFWSDWACECSGQICSSYFIALSVPELIGGTQKIGQSLDTPTPLCL